MVLIKKNQLRELSAKELQYINGGAATTGTASMSLSSSADSLVSLDFEWKQGDMSKSWKISAGNDIHLDLNAWGTGLK